MEMDTVLPHSSHLSLFFLLLIYTAEHTVLTPPYVYTHRSLISDTNPGGRFAPGCLSAALFISHCVLGTLAAPGHTPTRHPRLWYFVAPCSYQRLDYPPYSYSTSLVLSICSLKPEQKAPCHINILIIPAWCRHVGPMAAICHSNPPLFFLSTIIQ